VSFAESASSGQTVLEMDIGSIASQEILALVKEIHGSTSFQTMAKKVTISAKPTRPAGETEKAAEQWVASGKTDGPENMKRFTIDVPESLHRRIKMQCASSGLKMADEIRALFDKHFPPKAVE
jgi:hypothetical protein